jgi:hypothetical protein
MGKIKNPVAGLAMLHICTDRAYDATHVAAQNCRKRHKQAKEFRELAQKVTES